VDIVQSAETPDLVKGYGYFRDEALALYPDYQPETVNTDGWDHTNPLGKRCFQGRAHLVFSA